MFPHIDGEVLNDEVVIIHSSGSTDEPKVFKPYTRVCLPGILGDVGRRSEALWERRFLDFGCLADDHAWGASHRSPR